LPLRLRVEVAAQEHRAVFAFADPEPAVLDQLRLLSLKPVAVGGMAVVLADVIELARRALARLFQQLGFSNFVPTALAVRAIALTCAKPISLLETAWRLPGILSRFLPTAIKSPATLLVT